MIGNLIDWLSELHTPDPAERRERRSRRAMRLIRRDTERMRREPDRSAGGGGGHGDGGGG